MSSHPVSVNDVLFRPLGAHHDGQAINAAVDLLTDATAAKPTSATKIMLQTHSQNVRYTLDGTAPTATTGFNLKATDQPIILSIIGVSALKVIQEAATADLQFQWGF